MRRMIAADIGQEPVAPWLTFPIICMLRKEFDALPEYSATYPTGTTPGKLWRRHDGAHDPDPRQRKKAEWFVLEYYAVDRADLIGVRWYRPVLSRDMVEGDLWVLACLDGAVEAGRPPLGTVVLMSWELQIAAWAFWPLWFFWAVMVNEKDRPLGSTLRTGFVGAVMTGGVLLCLLEIWGVVHGGCG